MTSLSFIMEDYFSSKERKVLQEKKIIKVKKENWEKTDKTLSRKFVFEERKQVEAFIVEILKYLRESQADIVFSCRKETALIKIVSLAPYISELELETSQDIDKIKKDIFYYFTKE